MLPYTILLLVVYDDGPPFGLSNCQLVELIAKNMYIDWICGYLFMRIDFNGFQFEENLV